MKTTHEVLVAARNLIDREGWCRGGPRSYVPAPEALRAPHCALKALSVARGVEHIVDLSHDVYGHSDSPVFREARGALADAIGTDAVWVWNDWPGRTKAEVLAAFDKAISATAPAPADPLTGVVPTVEARASFREKVT